LSFLVVCFLIRELILPRLSCPGYLAPAFKPGAKIYVMPKLSSMFNYLNFIPDIIPGQIISFINLFYINLINKQPERIACSRMPGLANSLVYCCYTENGINFRIHQVPSALGGPSSKFQARI